LNVLAKALGPNLRPGDEIVVSAAEHHSNLIPWQMLRDRLGLVLRILPVTQEGRIDTAALANLATGRCRIIALTHVSNVTGAVTDVAQVVAAARTAEALVVLDGAQRVQHGPVDLRGLGVDFYAFSGHKAFGPTGIGVLWGRSFKGLEPVFGGGGMVQAVTAEHADFAAAPHRFEAGTPPVTQAIGLAAALDWLMAQDWLAVDGHERTLSARLLTGLRAIPGLRIIGPATLDRRLSVVSFAVEGVHPHDLCHLLDERGIAVRGGHHCAQPLLDALGIPAVCRASACLYNTIEEIDALLLGLAEAIHKLR
ncbi:MAG: aminotransferase class V-fold PLP-dependent enzyme, partial [Rhodospirillales bacterium]|nr:aminotransferase class V-fold PLP-dependent enzyme [Rhodospirillales bacterium]